MISINTHFHPFRLNLRRREPVQLSVELINRGDKNKMLSVELLLAKELALDKGGLHSGITKKIESLEPGERKQFYFDIYPKPIARNGELPVILNVLEHYRNFNFVEKSSSKRMDLTVEG